VYLRGVYRLLWVLGIIRRSSVPAVSTVGIFHSRKHHS